MIARPARVRIRRRNPCVLARRRLFGWNVRLLTAKLHQKEGKARLRRPYTGGRTSLRSSRQPVKPARRAAGERGQGDTPSDDQQITDRLWRTLDGGSTTLLAFVATGSSPRLPAVSCGQVDVRPCACAGDRPDGRAVSLRRRFRIGPQSVDADVDDGQR